MPKKYPRISQSQMDDTNKTETSENCSSGNLEFDEDINDMDSDRVDESQVQVEEDFDTEDADMVGAVSVSSQSVISSAPEEDTIILEASGGQVLIDDNLNDSESSKLQVESQSNSEFRDHVLNSGTESKFDANNPLRPWKHEGEIWLTNLLFTNGNMSRSTADEILGAFANGKMIMASGPVQFTNSRQMMKLLDIAAEKSVVT